MQRHLNQGAVLGTFETVIEELLALGRAQPEHIVRFGDDLTLQAHGVARKGGGFDLPRPQIQAEMIPANGNRQ